MKKEWSIPTRDTHFSKNEWVETHSGLRIWARRVGRYPLRSKSFGKMSGAVPVQSIRIDPIPDRNEGGQFPAMAA